MSDEYVVKFNGEQIEQIVDTFVRVSSSSPNTPRLGACAFTTGYLQSVVVGLLKSADSTVRSQYLTQLQRWTHDELFNREQEKK